MTSEHPLLPVVAELHIENEHLRQLVERLTVQLTDAEEELDMLCDVLDKYSLEP